MLTGLNEIVKLTFSNGMQLRCTPNHALFTTNRGYVAASELTPDDRVKVLDLPAPATSADWRLPSPALEAGLIRRPGERHALRLPEKWSPELGHYLGWLVGDGCLTDDSAVTVYGGDEEQEHVLPAHRTLLASMTGTLAKPSHQANGTLQLRTGRRAIRDVLEALGVSRERAAAKTVPHAIYQAPTEVVATFLRGLFDADGCVHDSGHYRYVGLGSASDELLRGVQRLLTCFGIFSRIYRTRESAPTAFRYERKDGSQVEYAAGPMFDLRISSRSIERFAEAIGFSLPAKSAKLARCVAEHVRYVVDEDVRLVERRDDGVELTYNLCEPRNHSYIVNGTIVRNCSEYMSLDNSACNLASINLLKYLDDEGAFDVEAFRQTVEVVFTAQEIIVGNADYPTDKIAETTRRFRQLGLGYANLGALLMAQGLPYDSPEGRAWAGTITALMTGHAYATSARTARRMGPFAGFAENAEPMVEVLRMHRAEVAKIDEDRVPIDLLSAAQRAWDDAVEVAEAHGVRNSQAVVIAPTGTIGLALDCDTTGIEPDLALTKAKKLVGGGTMFIVNQTVPRALAKLGYSEDEAAAIIGHIDEHKTIIGAPAFKAEHLPVFACSMGDNTIHYMGHVKMMAAVQPFISGAISKTANMPESATVEEVEQLYLDSWKLGIKAIALYRDNCKVGQPLATQKKEGATEDGGASSTLAQRVERVVEHVIVQSPVRQKLPRTRTSKTFSFRVADCHGYATVGEFEDGRPGEVFLKVAKQGSTLAGIMDAFAISVSHGLQYGVPLHAFVDMFTNMRFEPAGITDDPEIRIATSLVDYIFRRLAVEYLSVDERADLGIFTVSERLQPTLPGVEEAATPSQGGFDVLPPEDRAPSAALTAAPVETGTVNPTGRDVEVVLCYVCGDIMQRAGSCHACPSCGATSGCS